jgi:hypothetical protein
MSALRQETESTFQQYGAGRRPNGHRSLGISSLCAWRCASAAPRPGGWAKREPYNTEASLAAGHKWAKTREGMYGETLSDESMKLFS